MDNIYKFRVEIEGDAPSGESHPIYDDEKKQLLGAFVLDTGQFILGFISGVDHPTALHISTRYPFYFTPIEGADGKISHGIVSEVKISNMSKLTEARL